jgi:hypothetical protein
MEVIFLFCFLIAWPLMIAKIRDNLKEFKEFSILFSFSQLIVFIIWSKYLIEGFISKEFSGLDSLVSSAMVAFFNFIFCALLIAITNDIGKKPDKENFPHPDEW